MNKNKQIYKYIPVGNLFVNLEQNIFSLFFILVFRAKSFEQFHKLARRDLPIFLLRFVRVLLFTYEFYHKKQEYKRSGCSFIMTSNHYGVCLIKLRQGEYKVFNLKKKLVITIFPKGFTEVNVTEKIANIKKAEKCILAPKLIEWNLKQRYLIEEYKNMNICTYKLEHLNNYSLKISSIIGEIISTIEPKQVNLYDYYLKKIEKFISILTSCNNEASSLKNMKSFINHSMKMIKRQPNKQANITLVFSHGDFWQGNILIDRKQSSVIDWDSPGTRSFYYDFYFSMFMLVAKQTHFDKVNYEGLAFLSEKLEENIELFYYRLQQFFTKKSIYLNIVPKQFIIYRYLFYIELIVMKWQERKGEQNKKIAEINTWIQRFQYFESIRNE